MNFPLITNFNFASFTEFDSTEPKYITRHFSIKKNDLQIVFNTNFIACPCIYYVKKDDLFAFSFDVDDVVAFAKENNIELTDTYDNLATINDNIRKHIKVSIMKRYKYNVNFIERWKQVTLYDDGSFTVIPYDFEPFEYEIIDHYTEFKNFLLKYKNIVNKHIDDKTFIPTLTGGLDTRAFTGFYRDRVSELDGYFLNAVKQDGKNNVDCGQLELQLAEKVAKKIGLKLNRINKLEDIDYPYVTMTGMFNENADSYSNPNDLQYITKIIQHGWGNKYQYLNKITPYMDDDYLKFRQHNECTRTLLLFLLARDLIFIPFMSGSALFNYFPQGTTVFPVLASPMGRVHEIYCAWGINRVNNILVEQPNILHLDYIETDIVNRCNLNCKGCGHFSPLYKNDTWEKDPVEFEQELKLLNERIALKTFRIMGGEPLLHSNWLEMLRIARRCLPNTEIWLLSNGLLINKLIEHAEEINNLKIGICISRYSSVHINYSDFSKFTIRRIIDKHEFYKLHIDENGTQDKEESFTNCSSKKCLQLRDGRLYRCPEMLHFSRFNDFFNTGIKISTEDISIDLNANLADIEQFLMYNNTGCKYCNISKRNASKVDWEQSKLAKQEWSCTND